ncbi:hypothetical protein NC652_004282 [Populus alba x Populus x berolinensis]|nr:hypothetical protein NC652_004282 [Populus alba x Populus x berolinensis]
MAAPGTQLKSKRPLAHLAPNPQVSVSAIRIQ